MDVGYHALLSQVTGVHVATAKCLVEGQQERISGVSENVWNVNMPADRDNFRSLHAKAFTTPERFEFQPHHGDEVCTVICHGHLIEIFLNKINNFFYREFINS